MSDESDWARKVVWKLAVLGGEPLPLMMRYIGLFESDDGGKLGFETIYRLMNEVIELQKDYDVRHFQAALKEVLQTRPFLNNHEPLKQALLPKPQTEQDLERQRLFKEIMKDLRLAHKVRTELL